MARGGMGEVWLGRDVRLDREIAVKFLRFPNDVADEALVRRFDRESRITARLEHPGVPAVYDVGVHDGRPFLVMQRIHGISIADLVAEQGPLPIGWAANIAGQVCAVLVAAHAAALVHRDLKPRNLILEPDGSVKVLDFGLAVAPTLTDFSRITSTFQRLGTPDYMAPEQVEAGDSEPATDLYALGCTLHEMLTAEHVFSAPTPFAVMVRQVRDAPAPLRALRPDAPPELEKLILDLLEKKPHDRPAGALAVYERLLPFISGLPDLPGFLRPLGVPSSSRLYAGMLAKITVDDSSALENDSDAGVETPHDPLATAIMSPEWREVLRRSDQDHPSASFLLRELAVRALPVPVAVFDLGGRSRGISLAWPERKVAILLPADGAESWTAGDADTFIGAGWDARPVGAWNVEGLTRRLIG
ncbi:serine/threonine-protein kinase [Actinoplanes couchii]|uniref:serine/threonine-protein kinase n=1 Tax=Actinoplanes couchii TaxID=403638 RepID=UPI001EF1A2FF|nr:serine/threonine-protein kinase [Actinoplanes couchii]MDR6324693.1 serine/threonine protein kinase [Actinoplanes couchii]